MGKKQILVLKTSKGNDLGYPQMTIVTPPSGRGLVIPIFFRGFFFWWSLAPDLRFSLGQTNTGRVFRYTGKGFYLE